MAYRVVEKCLNTPGRPFLTARMLRDGWFRSSLTEGEPEARIVSVAVRVGRRIWRAEVEYDAAETWADVDDAPFGTLVAVVVSNTIRRWEATPDNGVWRIVERTILSGPQRPPARSRLKREYVFILAELQALHRWIKAGGKTEDFHQRANLPWLRHLSAAANGALVYNFTAIRGDGTVVPVGELPDYISGAHLKAGDFTPAEVALEILGVRHGLSPETLRTRLKPPKAQRKSKKSRG